MCKSCGALYPVEGKIVKFLESIPIPAELQEKEEIFSRIASAYDNLIISLIESYGCPWQTYIERLEEIVHDLLEHKLIVDVGSGTSFPIGTMIPADSIYVGVDISFSMLREAEELLRENINVTLLNTDVSQIPLEDNSVDTILSILSFNSFQFTDSCINEIKRIAKGNALFLGVFLEKDNFLDTIKIDRALSWSEIESVLKHISGNRSNYRMVTKCGALRFCLAYL